MIHFLSTRRHDYSMRRHLDGPAATLAEGIRLTAYEDVLDADDPALPAGTWIFTDFDRISADAAQRAARLWQRLADREYRLLNHPTRSLRRYSLMQVLHADGVNDYRAHPLDDLRPPGRWPVFLRRADAHNGPASRLLPDQARLDRALVQLRADGCPLHVFLAVEICDTRDPDGLYRKYGALKIGPAIFPFHVIAAAEWMVKHGTQGIWSPAHLEWEADFIARNPHADSLRPIFARAGIDFGRIDYGLRDGRIQVWEINSNPGCSGPATRMAERAAANRLTNDRIAAALTALHDQAAVQS